jgi:hypothetical protein
MDVLPRTTLSALLFVTTALLAGRTPAAPAAPVGTGFSYQGRLSDGGQPATARYDFRFSLYLSATGATPAGSSVTNANVAVSNGLFSTTVDFGQNVFTGAEYWMEVAVRGGGSADPFTPMSPRQLLTPTPYALHAQEAGGLPDGAITGAALQDGSVVRSINGLKDNFRIVGGEGVVVETGGGSIIISAAPPSCTTYSNCYWNLLGNGNITAGVNFLGTVAGELDPLEFRVNNNRSLLHTFTGAGTSPNITGGYKGNLISGTGGTIGGGGQLSGIHRVQASWGTVGGGYSNLVLSGSTSGTVGGGATNQIVGRYGAIAGGGLNIASNYSAVAGGNLNRAMADSAAIGGGEANLITGYDNAGTLIPSPYSTISGGISNVITGGDTGTIGGGEANRVVGINGRQVFYATIAGGQGNAVLSENFESHYSSIGGGVSNSIHIANRATIGGGDGNRMQLEAHYSTIGGGVGNFMDGPYGVISGGSSNTIVGPGNPDYATIGGGSDNVILADSHYATIAGGRRNHLEGSAKNSSVGGGLTNSIISAEFATIAGGGTNSIADSAHFATIGGGRANAIGAAAPFGTIGGGSSNSVTGDFATVPGGDKNQAGGNYSQAAGRRANAQHNGSFVWADDTDAQFSSTSAKQFAVRADNGVMIQANTRALDLRGGGSVRVAGAGLGTATPAFIHRATAGNIVGNFTSINHPHCNGDPNAILTVTPNWNPGGVGGTYNNHPIGVYYTGAVWAIFNQDLANMPVDAAFNVLVIKP